MESQKTQLKTNSKMDATSKKKKYVNEIDLPENIEVNLDGFDLKIKGPKGELVRRFYYPNVYIKLKENKIVVGSDISRKEMKRMVNTFTAHIKNMIKGVRESHKYVLKIKYGHFPMTVSVNNNKLIVKNFLGEKKPRELIFDNSNVKISVNNDEVVVESIDIEKAGQTAANIEQLLRITNRDRRRFQDGIWIIEKSGKRLL